MQREIKVSQTGIKINQSKVQINMIHQHTLQTSAAFDRIHDALLGKTDDSLYELIEDIEFLLYKAKQISDTKSSVDYSDDFNPMAYCDIPKRY